METRQMTPFFHLLFLTFIFVFENSQNSFSCDPTFGPFWPVKYLNFEQKLPIRTVHHNFLKSRHPEVFKICIMFCPLRRAKKTYQLVEYKHNQNLSSY